MQYGICNLSIVPVRAEASDKAEIVTQLLFGDHFEVISTHKQWKKISTAFDKYIGYIDEKQFLPIDQAEFNKLQTEPAIVCMDMIQVLVSENQVFPLVIGSRLPFLKGNSFEIAGKSFQYEGHTRSLDMPVSDKKQVIENAFVYMNSPYLWGGRSPFGIDCSGLTQMAYKLSGVSLRRDAAQQAEQGMALNFLDEAEPGDLAFFDNAEGKVIHVGIILSGNQIIHSSGKVRVDKLDHHGIFNEEKKIYTHKLRVVKKIL